MPRSTTPLLAAPILTALLAVTPNASAARHTVYKVELEGTYAYSIAADHREQGFRRQTALTAKGVFVSDPGELSFVDGGTDDRPGSQTRAGLDVLFRSSGSQVETSDDEHGVHDVRTCTVDDRPLHGQRAQGWVQQSLLQPLVPDAPVNMDVRISNAFEIPFVATDRCPAGSGPVLGSTAAETLGRMDAEFELPRETTTAGKTIQWVKGPSRERCPGSESPEVVACTFTWEGQITLTKILDEVLDDGPTAPSPTGAAPASATPAVKAPAAAPTTAPAKQPAVKSKRATAAPNAKTVAFATACPAGCVGAATITVPGAASAKATVPFSVAPGAGGGVTLTIPAKTRHALQRTGRGSLAIRLAAPGATPVLRTLALRVRR